MSNKGGFLIPLTPAVKLLAVLTAVGLLLFAAPALAREIFRDGRWITVPDDSDIEPAAGDSPVQPDAAATPAPPPDTASEPATTPDAPDQAASDPETAPAPEQDIAENQDMPPAKEHQPEATLQPDAPEVVVTPARPDAEPGAGATVYVAENTADSPVLVDQVTSVGAKYRDHLPIQAVDEVRQMLADAFDDAPPAVQESVQEFERENFGRVRRTTRKYLKRDGAGVYGEAAQWLQGEAAFAQQQYYPASQSYDAFLDSYAGSYLSDKALRRQMESAEALLGPARVKVLGLPILSGDSEAIDILHGVYGRSPSSPLAADALFRIGEYRFQKGSYVEAQEVFIQFAREFPNHGRTRQAELLAAQSGMNAINGATYDISTMERSKEILLQYQEKYPAVAAEEKVPEALQTIREVEALKRLEMARYYNRAGKPKAAAFYARRVMDRYASTPQAAEARSLLEELGGKLAKEES